MRFLSVILISVCTLILCACTYKLAGTAQPLPFKSIAVTQVENNAYVPQAAPLLTRQVCTRFAQTPAVELRSLSDADAILEITLDDYTKSMYASRQDDTALAAAITVVLRAKCTLRERASGKIIYKDRDVSVSSHVYSSNGSLLNPEYQNMTSLTAELAKRIVEQALGVW